MKPKQSPELQEQIEKALIDLHNVSKNFRSSETSPIVDALKAHGTLLYLLSKKESEAAEKIGHLTQWLVVLTVALSDLTAALVFRF